MVVPTEIKHTWKVPNYTISFFSGKKHNYCIVIPVINEGQRIIDLLQKMKNMNISDFADIIIIDGGSTDNSLEINRLKDLNVSSLLIKLDFGKLSAQLRCAYAFALDNEYNGIITIDGNNKDDPSAIPEFLLKLKEGYDFIQGSRFIKNGKAINTPKSRDFAIRFIHAPILSISSGFKWTDTTQGFRGYSKKMLLDPKIAPFRSIFDTYELLAYLSYRVPKLNYKCIEVPTSRIYPKGKIPTKINGIKGNIKLLQILFNAALGQYNPKKSENH